MDKIKEMLAKELAAHVRRMKEQTFRAGYASAIELMKEFDGAAIVTDDLIKYVEERAGVEYEKHSKLPRGA